MTLREQVAQAMRDIPRHVPVDGTALTVEWHGRRMPAMYVQEPDDIEKDRMRADAAIRVVVAALVEQIEALRQWHIDDHGDAECMTTREIAYGEVLALVRGAGGVA